MAKVKTQDWLLGTENIENWKRGSLACSGVPCCENEWTILEGVVVWSIMDHLICNCRAALQRNGFVYCLGGR